MLWNEPLATFMTFVQVEFNKKSYHNSQQITDSFIA